MKIFHHDELKSLIEQLFAKCGCRAHEAERIAHNLVEANLAGHDSHGVIRAPLYVDYIRRDMVRVNQSLTVIFRTDSLAIVDGNVGFGQTIGEEAMQLGIEMAAKHGIAVIGLKNCGHLGRIGDWPAYVTKAGMASLHFVNTNGYGLLVAPFGGIDRRLSANPIAAGIPVPNGEPIILDISTSAIAEGKVKVARNAGKTVPANCMIDHQGKPTTKPSEFYTDPPGALLPFGAHKGYGLGVIAEMFAGAMTGNGCSNPANNERLLNGMFTLIVDPERLPAELGFGREVTQFIDFVKSSRRLPGCDEILLPGEIEQRTRRRRLENGIQLDQNTWESISECCKSVGVVAN